MTNIPKTKLNSGYDIPMIGFGTYAGTDTPEQIYNAAKFALDMGYRHFDTAAIYRTERVLGTAIKESQVLRGDLFITTKLWQTFHDPQHVRGALDHDLNQLQMDYVDLYLVHWPISWEFRGYDDISFTNQMKPTHIPLLDTWKAMEQLVKDGKARSIGVSNFTVPLLQDILDHCEIPPAMNQVELHPGMPQIELVEFCKKNNIMLTGYSPLGNPGYHAGGVDVLEEQVVLDLSKKYNKTPVQVLINWGLNRGYCVIPKSKTPSRINENSVFFEMEAKDVDAITALGEGRTRRIFDPVRMFGPENKVF